MENLLANDAYSFLSNHDKTFIVAFDRAITQMGYESSGIQPYVCLGRYKIEYSKAGLKTKKFVARFYFRDEGAVLRLYFTGVDKHREYLESAPDFIKDPFINGVGQCKQCDQSGGGIGKKGKCSFKKTYTLDGVVYEKCAGENYYFDKGQLDYIPEYIGLLARFYPDKRPRETPIDKEAAK